MPNKKSPCCATDCCQSGCEDCPYDYKNTIDPTLPRELALGRNEFDDSLNPEEETD
jgi:hypothetical protein